MKSGQVLHACLLAGCPGGLWEEELDTSLTMVTLHAASLASKLFSLRARASQIIRDKPETTSDECVHART